MSCQAISSMMSLASISIALIDLVGDGACGEAPVVVGVMVTVVGEDAPLARLTMMALWCQMPMRKDGSCQVWRSKGIA